MDGPTAFARSLFQCRKQAGKPRKVGRAAYAVCALAHTVQARKIVDLQSAGIRAESFDLKRHGLTNKEIARRLQVSVNTVKKHFDKRRLHSRRQAVARVFFCLNGQADHK